MASIQVDLTQLEARLGGALPIVYRTFVTSKPLAAIEERGFDPKTLLVLNLQRRSWDHLDSAGRLFLNGDGCGNYYFTELEAAASRVQLWSHDPPGIEDPEMRLGSYLREEEQLCRIDEPASPNELYICRSDIFSESILAPIELGEWIAAVEATEGITHVGYREGLNPFTKETIRVEIPGLARIGNDARTFARFLYGRAELDDCPEHRALAEQLAEKLNAHVLWQP